MSGFEGMWRRPLSDYEKGAKEYLVTLDTNVLLNLYRFTPQARNELLSVLRTLQERLWVSHQVAKEYYSRRLTAVNEHITLYTSVPKALNDTRNKALQELNTFAKRRSMAPEDRQKLIDPLNKAFESVIAEIRKHGEAFDLSLAKVATNDPILEALAEILDQKTGAPFEEEESRKLIEGFAERADKKIPPGYKDANKADNAHGDYFVWEQVLREAASRKMPVLLVTNDAKEDWIQLESGITIGPRPELVREFKERCGLDFLLADLGTFLKVAVSELGAAISESTVAQAENIGPSATGNGSEQVRIAREEYNDVVENLIARQRNLHSAFMEPGLGVAEREVFRRRRSEMEDALTLARNASTIQHSDGTESMQMNPEEWEAMRKEGGRFGRGRTDRRQTHRVSRQSNLHQRSDVMQNQLQEVHLERDSLTKERGELEALISLQDDKVDRDEMQMFLEMHDATNRRLEALQEAEENLMRQLRYVQLRLREKGD
ncbi:PIN-like domain-containing protein [Streptomyces sp. NBC_00887]|uniref:PIN-like domain-containing protein n=1 Tax=Streptomyces sp. NBC_00887 TaxID=2975859 RepID=UPI00386C8A17|nr:PIN domain-containing protein [Streptomyces sp. NBC_00887]